MIKKQVLTYFKFVSPASFSNECLYFLSPRKAKEPPPTSKAIPPMMYPIVFEVKRPDKFSTTFSPMACEEFIPNPKTTRPTTKRTIPNIRITCSCNKFRQSMDYA